ncbi:MAG: Thioredoxin [uncultured Sulfurovum sp.]|uniref:Thioredoxin n=1 Tax=uncultured Sulfurovum sp. TaxID=269237 RepID=A0A6S6SVI6_9BACT|nr:MAG: Thioredoxin [uncultured Sulfurovum sp.]
MSNVIELRDDNFDEVVMNTSSLVMVDFWAEWCGPCKMIDPIIKVLAEEYEGQVIVGKVNVDLNPETASKYGIRSIPSTFFFKDGLQVDDIRGVGTRSSFQLMLDKHL